jgi:Asp-tRNA(Asn)/Glu-tRNA(Gln) amidotransferase A subunit family amidase
MIHPEFSKPDRRLFVAGICASGISSSAHAQKSLRTLIQWLEASEGAREQGVQACLARIREREPSIQAWVQVKPEPPTAKGMLSGIPFGVKDIIETKGLATEYGSPVYKGRIGTADAAIVSDLRNRGAVLLGKTQAAAFAFRDPPPTRNPRDIAHTPGGSSGGSAAAVAAGMVPFAIGTQTSGSTLRPASYCGVTGFKTSYGLLPMEGVLPFARSFDALGFFTPTAADMLALWEAMGHPIGHDEAVPLAVADPLPSVEPAMAGALQNLLAVLRKAGLTIKSVDISAMLSRLHDAQNTVKLYEGARFHEQRYKQYGARLGAIAGLVRDGLKISAGVYDQNLQFIAECRTRVAALYSETPIILVPAATGPAPLGLAETGDARMNTPWSALGTPAISIPMPVGATLPLGLQLTADRGQDARLLRTAVRLQNIIGGN